jgi:D-sedoheptulose 7-phosphate isomerase
MSLITYLNDSIEVLKDTVLHLPTMQAVDKAITVICGALKQGLPLLVCGNGGSASDAQHIAGELVGRFLKERKAYNVICLADNAAIMTAIANDYAYDQVFSRQVEGYGKRDGVILGISTSGNSANVINAFKKARELGMITIGLTGQGGGKLADLSDILIEAPSNMTPHIQQVHLCLYHYMCFKIEDLMCSLPAESLDSSLQITNIC